MHRLSRHPWEEQMTAHEWTLFWAGVIAGYFFCCFVHAIVASIVFRSEK